MVQRKRMGRPTLDPKVMRKDIRLSRLDCQKLEYCIRETGLTGNEIIRKGIDRVYQELQELKK